MARASTMRSLASSSPWARYADSIAISTCVPLAVFAIASAPNRRSEWPPRTGASSTSECTGEQHAGSVAYRTAPADVKSRGSAQASDTNAIEPAISAPSWRAYVRSERPHEPGYARTPGGSRNAPVARTAAGCRNRRSSPCVDGPSASRPGLAHQLGAHRSILCTICARIRLLASSWLEVASQKVLVNGCPGRDSNPHSLAGRGV